LPESKTQPSGSSLFRFRSLNLKDCSMLRLVSRTLRTLLGFVYSIGMICAFDLGWCLGWLLGSSKEAGELFDHASASLFIFCVLV
jgi:hypothetical protein